MSTINNSTYGDHKPDSKKANKPESQQTRSTTETSHNDEVIVVHRCAVADDDDDANVARRANVARALAARVCAH
jgi:hypothetical protein